MTYKISRLGWLPDPLDHRDLNVRDAGIRARLNKVVKVTSRGVRSTAPAGVPGVAPLVVDLRQWCSDVEDQGRIGSCTAQAVVGALEYFERKTRGHHVDASRLFLYRATRRYLGWEGRGDTGAFVRSAMKALRLFGTVPEAYWPYEEERFDDEPEAFHYSFANNFKAIEYYRVPENVAELKQLLLAGIPFAFGFTCYTSLFAPEVKRSGVIPHPSPSDRVEGGHAVLAVGFSESHVLIRNSWGPDWGDQGYGYLPWSYFDSHRPLATDCWILVNASWVPETDAALPESDGLDRELSRELARAAAPPPPRGDHAPAEREKLRPRIAVVRGSDPTRNAPLRFEGQALTADRAAALALVESVRPVSLYLRKIELLDSFDWALFGSATNELYLCAIAWDLSGAPPRVFPPGQLESQAGKTYNLEERQRVEFVGDGLQLWPSSKIVGALYVRLLIMESDQDLRDAGAHFASVHRAVDNSALRRALAALTTGAAAAAPALAAVAVAADSLGAAIASILRDNGDDVVALFDGTYGAENVTASRSEPYRQTGAAIELAFTVSD